MDERAEWLASINSAPTIELRVTRARTYLAQLRSDSDNGGPPHTAEIAEVRQVLAELKKEK